MNSIVRWWGWAGSFAIVGAIDNHLYKPAPTAPDRHRFQLSTFNFQLPPHLAAPVAPETQTPPPTPTKTA